MQNLSHARITLQFLFRYWIFPLSWFLFDDYPHTEYLDMSHSWMFHQTFIPTPLTVMGGKSKDIMIIILQVMGHLMDIWIWCMIYEWIISSVGQHFTTKALFIFLPRPDNPRTRLMKYPLLIERLLKSVRQDNISQGSSILTLHQRPSPTFFIWPFTDLY